MAADPRTRCKAVRSPRGARTTEIEWGDGHRGIYPHEILRGYCPCAGCQGHEGSIKFIQPHGDQLEIDSIETVGNYALQITWFDRHGSGIYSYAYLRALCQCSQCVPESEKDARDARPRM